MTDKKQKAVRITKSRGMRQAWKFSWPRVISRADREMNGWWVCGPISGPGTVISGEMGKF
jgi:hypothetical protein